MPLDPNTLLYDMKQAAERIVRYVGNRTFDEYLQDDYFRSAVERQFEIIGEAMTRVRTLSPEIAAKITSHSKISGFRNNLIHGYNQVDHTITWNIILHHLPVLRAELDELLKP